MRVTIIDGHFVAEGEASECAMWTYLLVLMEREIQEKKNREMAKAEVEAISKMIAKPIEEILRQERKDSDNKE